MILVMAISGELNINLNALQHNYKLLDNISSHSCDIGVSIKADAYGLGAKDVAKSLYDVGARHFFVANIDEAEVIRSVLPKSRVYILNGFFNKDKFVYLEKDFIPVLNFIDEIKKYQIFAKEENHRLPAVIHFDTGMNRLGLSDNEANIICNDLSLLDGIRIEYIMSHFSSSDEKDSYLNNNQYKKFLEISSYFKDVKRSLCNSGGVFLSSDYHMDLIRAGIALYGGKPVAALPENPMRQVVSLNVPVLQIKSVKKGDYVGYNASYRFESDCDIAIVAIGYADGFFRCLSNGAGALYYNGYKMPVCGRVSMDLVVCSLENIVDKSLYPNIGDMVEVIGVNQTIDQLAKSANTISYEILTSLGGRYKRHYIGL